MELQHYLDKFREQGYGVCAILYDSVAILADFSRRKNITFPLLSDSGSQIIREFGILNTYVPRGHFYYGIPYPGTYVVDREGIVQSKYFETSFRDRISAPTILLREFGSEVGTRMTQVETDHLKLKYYSTQDVVRPSLRLTLVADFELKPKMHVYAPTVQGYIPIQLELEPSFDYVAHAVEYPAPEMLHLPAIQETVPVYRGKFRLQQDITMGRSDVLWPIFTGSREIKIRGRLRYQACDDKICYLPQNIPLEWSLKVYPPEREPVPKAIRHPRRTGIWDAKPE